MRVLGAPLGAAALATAVMAGVGSLSPVRASPDWGLNGTYIATSNGDWAKTNDSYRNEASVSSRWTITSVCSYPTECSGTVKSDQGWSAVIYQKSGSWYVKRTLDNWEPCPDGTAVAALQMYRFWPATSDGSIDPGSSTLIGEDHTMAPSGACGVNKPKVITMPFKLVKSQ